MALDADRKNGPAARSFAADAHDCIMVRIKRPYRIQVCGTKMRPQWRAPLGFSKIDRHRQTLKLCRKKAPVAGHHRSACSGVKALRNTSDARRQAAKLCYRFGPLTPSARSANLIAGDGTKNGFPAPNKEPAKTKNHHLTGKAPYKFESISLQRRVPCELAPHCFGAPPPRDRRERRGYGAVNVSIRLTAQARLALGARAASRAVVPSGTLPDCWSWAALKHFWHRRCNASALSVIPTKFSSRGPRLRQAQHASRSQQPQRRSSTTPEELRGLAKVSY
jgi:hypothetical protein